MNLSDHEKEIAHDALEDYIAFLVQQVPTEDWALFDFKFLREALAHKVDWLSLQREKRLDLGQNTINQDAGIAKANAFIEKLTKEIEADNDGE